ncbi:MAG: DNA polymerase III subunit delta [Clostridiales Family XIII bacterium]|jgi:DNA polymerase-3 subunit delta|nr:DNA polymerase III subunit delta [Clostridiales Family XIII bacterium]
MRKTAQHAFKTIESDIERGILFSARALLLFGEELYLVDHYERIIRDKYISSGAEAIDCTRVDWDAKDVAGAVSSIVAVCDTLPMISERRVVLVSVSPGDEKSLGFVDTKPLASYISSVPETTILIIKSASFPKNSVLYKALDGYGKAYEFTRLDRCDLPAFIRGRFKRAGAVAPPEVVSEIIKVSGYLDREPRSDLFRLSSDAEKIAAYARGGRDIDGTETTEAVPPVATMSDVAACMGTSLETDVFAMLDAVSADRKGESLELLCNITSRGGNAFGLLALMTGQFEIMLGYREMRDKGASMDEIMKALSIKSGFRMKKAAAFADRYGADRIAQLLHRLYRVDRDIKSGLYSERLALTMFVAGM